MREILFRGKRKDNGEWVYGGYFHETLYYGDEVDRHWIIIYGEFDYDNYEAYEVIPETVGQYTCVYVGGENLFEGDIVEWHEDYDDLWGYSRTVVGRSVVIWDEENFCWAFKTDDKHIQSFNDWNWNSSYIIGNIHDNPELLKGGAE